MTVEWHSTEDVPRSLPSPAACVLLALAASWCIYWFVHALHYWEDDAYIHLEFARSLAEGRGFAFNGCVVAGDTSPLWVLLLASAHGLVPDWLVAGKLLTVLGAAFAFSGIYAFARRLMSSMFPSAPGAALFPAAMVWLIAANPFFCYWVFSGMESVTASGLALWAVLGATRTRPSTASFLAACLTAGIAPLLRPEMVFLVLLLAPPLFDHWRRIPRKSRTHRRIATLFCGLLLLAAPLAIWCSYSHSAFGGILPNTNSAKRAAPSDSVVRHLLSIYSLGFPIVLGGLIVGVVHLLLRPSVVRHSIQGALAQARGLIVVPAPESARVPDGRLDAAPTKAVALPAAGWIFILWSAVAALFYIVDHTYVQTRYLLITGPGLAIVVTALALRASNRVGRALYLTGLLLATLASIVMVRPFLGNKVIEGRAYRNMAFFIRDRVPPGAPVATYVVGQIAFFSGHPIVDTSGITRPAAVPYLYSPLPNMVRWARSQGALYYLEGNRPELGAVSVLTIDRPFVGWTVRTRLYKTFTPVSLWKLRPDLPQRGIDDKGSPSCKRCTR